MDDFSTMKVEFTQVILIDSGMRFLDLKKIMNLPYSKFSCSDWAMGPNGLECNVSWNSFYNDNMFYKVFCLNLGYKYPGKEKIIKLKEWREPVPLMKMLF